MITLLQPVGTSTKTCSMCRHYTQHREVFGRVCPLKGHCCKLPDLREPGRFREIDATDNACPAFDHRKR